MHLILFAVLLAAKILAVWFAVSVIVALLAGRVLKALGKRDIR